MKILLKYVFALIIIVGTVFIWFKYLSNLPGEPDVSNIPSNTPIVETNLPVFPGAEGFGSKTRAGRGGKVIEVTSLADSGPGTLREALEDPNPRIIVFRVGGLIEIDEPFYIRYPFVTIAGQTAPGDGITIKNGGITILTHDILLQSLRVRPGAEGKSVGKDNDSIGILGPKFAGDSYNIVLDHISVSWAEDENISIYEGPSNITVSWSIISEGLNKSRHQEGEHSTGLLIGDRADKVSVHHNIFAHNEQRNPMNKNGGTLDIRNNVIYNWGNDALFFYDVFSNTFANIVGNTFIAGLSTNPDSKAVWVQVRDVNDKPSRGLPKFFIEGNSGRGDMDTDEGIVKFIAIDPDPSFIQGSTLHEKIEWAKRTYLVSKPFETPKVTTQNAASAYEKVLGQAGASKPKRDAVDTRIVSDIRTRTGRIIDSPSQVGGYPRYSGGVVPADSDHDGMSDEWEKKTGLNPSDASDGNKDLDGDGYANIEEYLHSLL
ncbi:TPA: pectate lyase [Candidatus Nomurabacteria bacterium]|nr:pectate lyase [Candidatus Nomurabacteria bacterium]